VKRRWRFQFTLRVEEKLRLNGLDLGTESSSGQAANRPGGLPFFHSYSLDSDSEKKFRFIFAIL
jgi:hypothetical protein